MVISVGKFRGLCSVSILLGSPFQLIIFIGEEKFRKWRSATIYAIDRDARCITVELVEGLDLR